MSLLTHGPAPYQTPQDGRALQGRLGVGPRTVPQGIIKLLTISSAGILCQGFWNQIVVGPWLGVHRMPVHQVRMPLQQRARRRGMVGIQVQPLGLLITLAGQQVVVQQASNFRGARVHFKAR